MKKIAILTSRSDNASRRLAAIFHEGNRVRVSLVVTNREDVAEDDSPEGIAVRFFPREVWREDASAVATLFAENEIDIIVNDCFSEELPESISAAYAGHIVEASDDIEATAARIAAMLRCKAPEETRPQASEPPALPSSTPPPLPSVAEAWAQRLGVEIDSEEKSVDVEIVEGGSPVAPATPKAPEKVADKFGEPMPPTYLLWSVLAVVLCCLAPGVVALIFSAQVSGKYYQGDLEGSRRASRNAEIWIIISFVLGLLSATLYLPMMLIS